MTGPTDDLTLIAECRAGRTDAFGSLVQRYQDRLYPTALRLTGSVEDALDLLQDAFLQSFRKLNRFHGESSFYTWVYRVMVNLALSERRKRLPKLFRNEPLPEASDPADSSDLGNPTAQVDRQEREAAVQRALGKLAPDHRVVVVMKEFDGMRYEEIAAALNVPVGTVRSRLHRARCELKGLLSDYDEAEPPASPPSTPSNVAEPTTNPPLIVHAEARGR